MGKLQFRKRIKLNKFLTMNISNKKISFTKHLGKLTISPNGQKSIKLGNGFSYKFGKKK